MSKGRLVVMHPGLFLMGPTEPVLAGWGIGMQPESDVSRDNLIVSIRDYIVQALDSMLEDASLRTDGSDAPEPVSTAVERDAEMETILLMSRCMGYG